MPQAVPASSRRDIVIRIGGEAGEGVVSAGELLARAAARSGLEVCAARNVPTEVQGGHAFFTVRFGREAVPTPGDTPDILLAFNGEACARHAGSLRKGALFIYNTDAGILPADGCPAEVETVGIPLDAMAREEAGSKRARNIVALGCCAEILGIPLSRMEELVAARYGGAGADSAGKNAKALRAGAAFARGRARPRLLPPPATSGAPDRLLLTGNAATALGAIAAGCRRYYGYPITPATEILEILAAELPKLGGCALQVEDELAALAMCLGSSFAGEKAMTATSGPGFSLLAELLGLAGMAEIPVVVVDVQRAGPSTGLPTRTEQGDLLAAVFCGHGEFPRAVVAPVDVEDAFRQAVRAFDLAERFQIPVLCLTDQDIAQRLQTVNRKALADVPPAAERPRTAARAGDGFRRYATGAGGVSPMPVPGTPGLCWRAAGQEHDERGMPSASPENHVRMMRKRAGKLEVIPEDACGIATAGDPAAETLVLGWGSTFGAVREAVERLTAGGMPVFAVYPKLLWPYPARTLGAHIARARRVIVPETNFSGQWARLVEMHHPGRVHRVNRFDGQPFAPGELADRFLEIVRRPDA